MARIQQKSSGHRVVRERLDAAALKDALKASLARHGLQQPRFGQMDLSTRPRKNKEV